MNNTENRTASSTETENRDPGIGTLDFKLSHMMKLVTAHDALMDLEKLLSLLCGIDTSNKILLSLHRMDNLLHDLSPLYDDSLDYDGQPFSIILHDTTISIPVRARLLLGTKKDYETFEAGKTIPEDIYMEDALGSSPDNSSAPTVPFTVDNMVDLMIASKAYRSLDEVLEMFMGTYLEHEIIFGLAHLCDLLENISPVYHNDYDGYDDENKEYYRILNSFDLSFADKARKLMGKS